MKKIFFVFVFLFTFPIFSQNVEPTDDAILQLWDSMSEEEKNTILKEFLDSETQFKQPIIYDKKYLSGRTKLKTGIILTSTSALAAPITSLMVVFAMMDHTSGTDNVRRNVAALSTLWFVNTTAFAVGVPMTIVGAKQKRKYKPTIAISPNAVKFAVEF